MVALIHLVAPKGPIWVFLAITLVILLGPWLAERARIPGIVGLLVGGLVIGPHALDIVHQDDSLVPALGQIGLLYLMFLAGVELDFAVFRRYRRAAAIFALVTFTLPFVLGYTASTLLGYTTAAALLLGSLSASHTLVTYPAIRRLGLSSNRAVATAVAATVITDTMSLLVLAVVSGTVTGQASGPALALQVGLGIASLVVLSFVIVPRIGLWFFAGIGQERTLRFVFVLAVLSAAAVLAQTFGIEGIVGAFFAGLGMNRLVPNRSPLMEKIEFFGSALFIPLFLISVGLIIDPAVMVRPRTLAFAAVLIAACLGGKALASASSRLLFGFSGAEAGTVFALSSPQAAATLAATIVGFRIGLFSEVVVNGVLVLIVVSLIVSSVAALSFGRRVPRPVPTADQLGRTVVLAMGDEEDLRSAARVAARIAESDGGVVLPTRVQLPSGHAEDGAEHAPRFDVAAAERELASTGIDVEVRVRVDRSVQDGIVNTVIGAEATLLVLATSVGRPARPRPSRLQEIVARTDTAIVTVHTPIGLEPAPARLALLLTDNDLALCEPEVMVGARLAGMLRRTGLSIETWCPKGVQLKESVFEAIGNCDRRVWDGNRNAWLAESRPDTAVIVPISQLTPSAVNAFGVAGLLMLSVAAPKSTAPMSLAVESALTVVPAR